VYDLSVTGLFADSTLHLVYAEAINDAGEIVGIGGPPGVSPVDVERLGHAYVLIPDGDGGSLSTTSADPNANRLVGPDLSTNHKATTADLIRRLREHASRRVAIALERVKKRGN
jgi:hypothetical protein